MSQDTQGIHHSSTRFDLSAETTLPLADSARIARQVRQDVWRALQTLRGFSPVIEVTEKGDRLHIRAGGRVLPPIPPNAVDRIRDVLEDPANRRRWVRWARKAKR